MGNGNATEETTPWPVASPDQSPTVHDHHDGGGRRLLLGFTLPSRGTEAAIVPSQPWTSTSTNGAEVNAWLIIGSDDTVTIRVAQSEMGEGVFTSMPMLVAEELECDWEKVRAEYASANRNLRENRVYQRMATGGSGAVRRSREYLQQAGASARARLIAAAAQQWGVPARECRAEKRHGHPPRSGRQINYGAVAAAAAKSSLMPNRRSRLLTSSSCWANPCIASMSP